MNKPAPAISIRQIAKELGVSPSLVSLVVNDRWREHNIARETQARVVKRLEELNYRPNRLAISLRQKKTETVGVIIPVLATFYENVLRGVQRAVGSEYVLSLGVPDYTPATERRLVASFLERQVDGLVIVPTGDPSLVPLLREIKQKQVPLVLVDRYYPQVQTYYVGSDHVALGKMAANHLLEAGYPNLGCITTTPVTRSTMLKDRVAGMREVVRHTKTPFSLIEQDIQAHGFNHAACAPHALNEMLKRLKPPIGVFVISSLMAEELYRLCRKQGLRVPEDVGILTVDQPRNADDLYQMPLSTIRQQTQQIGETAGRYLSELIDGKRSPTKTDRCTLPASLTPLASTRFHGLGTKAPADPSHPAGGRS